MAWPNPPLDDDYPAAHHIITTPALRQRYIDTLQQQRRFAEVQQYEMEGLRNIVADNNVPPNVVYVTGDMRDFQDGMPVDIVHYDEVTNAQTIQDSGIFQRVMDDWRQEMAQRDLINFDNVA